MREIPLKEVNFNLEDLGGGNQIVPFSYRETMLSIINSPAEKGFSIEDIEQRIYLREKLRNAETSVRLEETEYAFLKALIEKERWRVAHEVVIDFVKEFMTAKRVE